MTITVLLFAAARDRAGTDSVEIRLAPGATVADLRAALADRFPALGGLLTRSAVAVNHDYADDRHPLRPGDEVAVVPPVSGG